MATKTGRIGYEALNYYANTVQVNKLETSGIDIVLNSCLYAIIGAIALQRGGAVAAEVAREKVLKPLGIA